VSRRGLLLLFWSLSRFVRVVVQVVPLCCCFGRTSMVGQSCVSFPSLVVETFFISGN